jgi:hypothetical protein
MAYTTIDDPTLFFRVKAYSGTGSAHAETFDITDTSMQPDMVWIKNRDTTGNHGIWDAVRGATKQIYPNVNYSESTAANSMTAFNSNGFSVGTDGDQNGSGNKLVAWCWKESATAGFDIVSFTGNATNRTISHSLSAVPKMIIVKNRTDAVEWQIYHQAIGNDYSIFLDLDNGRDGGSFYWNDTTPTSSVFSVGTYNGTNGSSDNMIAYCFADIKGYSKFGSYKGNGNADGPMNFLGFKPAFVIVKQSTAAGNSWNIFDNKREGYNPDNDALFADVDSTETTTDYLDLLSNGFKIRNNSSAVNTSGETYIYMAFAESPFVNSNGVPTNGR